MSPMYLVQLRRPRTYMTVYGPELGSEKLDGLRVEWKHRPKPSSLSLSLSLWTLLGESDLTFPRGTEIKVDQISAKHLP